MIDDTLPDDVLDLAQSIADFENAEVIAGFCIIERGSRILSIDDAGCFFLSQRRVVTPQERREYCATRRSAQ